MATLLGVRGGRIDSSYCFLIDIGDKVSLAPNVIILAHDGSLRQVAGVLRICQVIISNNVFIGAGAIVLPGVTIGDDVIIGSGSVVTKNLPSNSVCAGSPCRIIKSMDEFQLTINEKINKGIIFDKKFEPMAINHENKALMKKSLEKDVGYYMCEECYKKIKC